jgi:hypothetical protein
VLTSLRIGAIGLTALLAGTAQAGDLAQTKSTGGDKSLVMIKANEKLSASSPMDDKGQPCEIYSVRLKAFAIYVIEMKITQLPGDPNRRQDSADQIIDKQFQPYLRLVPKGIPLNRAPSSDENRDWNPQTETHLVYSCPEDGDYSIYAGARAGNKEFSFGLTVRQLKSQVDKVQPELVGMWEKFGGNRLKSLKEAVVSESLTAKCPKDSVRGTPFKEYYVDFKSDHIYTVELRAFSETFMPYLRLEKVADPAKARPQRLSEFFLPQLRLDTFGDWRQVMSSSSRDIAGDVIAENFSTHLTYYSNKEDSGKFKVVATNYAGALGKFELAVREQPARNETFGNGPTVEIRDQLTMADKKDSVLRSSPCKDYWFNFERGFSYRIDLRTLVMGKGDEAISIDAVLRLEDDAGRELAFNDDEEAGFVQKSSTDAQITLACQRTGSYRIIATSIDGYYESPSKNLQPGCGVFALRVQKSPTSAVLTADQGPANTAKFPIACNLTNADPKDKHFTNSPSKAYAVRLEANATYQIDLESLNPSSSGFLRLEDENRRQLDFNYDTTLKNKNARIVFDCNRTGTYHIIVANVQEGAGDFTLKLKAKGTKD